MNREKLIEELELLPTAFEAPVYFTAKTETGEETNEIEDRKAIIDTSNNKMIDIVSKHYVLIQHKDAFKKVIDKLEIPEDAKVDFKTTAFNGTATLNVLFDSMQLDDGEQGITMGTTIRNSYNRSMTLGIQVLNKSYNNNEKVIILYGMRQICANGMKIKVPLGEMTNAELDKLNPEKDVVAVEKIGHEANLDKIHANIKHYGKKNFDMKFDNILNLISRSRNYVQNKINDAMKNKISVEDFEEELKKINIAPRVIEKMKDELAQEKNTMWEAYNVVTAYATHKVNNAHRKDELLDKAWDGFMRK